jgi:hypothetical protein
LFGSVRLCRLCFDAGCTHGLAFPQILTVTTPRVTMSHDFTSCLTAPENSPALDVAVRSTTQILKRALSIDELHEVSLCGERLQF